MAILERIIDKDLLSSFWGNASERIDARIAAAKASPATTLTAGLVKPGSGLAVAPDGTLSAKVDGSTIDFNSSGQLTAAGGGSAVVAANAYVYTSKNETLGKWTITYNGNDSASALCLYSDNWLYIGGISATNNNRTVSININNADGSNLTVNNIDYVNEGTVCRYGNGTIERVAPLRSDVRLAFRGYGYFFPCSILVYK